MTADCPKCHFLNPPDSHFCKECGTQLFPSGELPSQTQTLRLSVTVLSKGFVFAAKYQIIEELGRGGMGIVYKARDIHLKRMIALKLLASTEGHDGDQRRRLIQEAQTASALNHPNICTIYEVGEADGQAYIAMEYVEGQPLNKMTRPAGLSIEETIHYGKQLAEAVQHASSRNIIHRDLKTANIIITPDRRAKILDFGLAKCLQDDPLGQALISQISLTESGFIAGTPHYLAPEVLGGESASVQSDIWAFGMVLYEMVAGRLPFEDKIGFELASAIMRDSPPPLPEHTPGPLRSVIQKCLEKEPEIRFQDAGEVRTALEAIRFVEDAVPPTSRVSAWQKWRLQFLAGVFVIVCALIVMIITKHGGGPDPGKIQSHVSTGAKASLNPEANEYFEKAMFFLIPQFDLSKARTLLERTLELDPKFAEARAWYAFSFVLDIDSGLSNDTGSLYKAEEELRRALQDEPLSARVHSSLAALYFYQGRKELIPEEVRKALEIDPKEMDAKNWLANYYISNGDYSSARAVLSQLLEGNPLFFPPRMMLAEIMRQQGDISGAIAELDKILEQSPQNVYALQKKARTFIDSMGLGKARRTLESLAPENQKNYDIRTTWALLLALEGKRGEALQKIDADTLKFASLAPWTTSVIAEFYAIQGDPQKALEWLELAVRNGDERAEWFQRDALLISLRSHPRFKQILKSIADRRQRRIGTQEHK